MIKESKINDIFRIFIGRFLMRAEAIGKIDLETTNLFKKECWFACNNIKKECYDNGILNQDVDKYKLDPTRVNKIEKPEKTIKVADK